MLNVYFFQVRFVGKHLNQIKSMCVKLQDTVTLSKKVLEPVIILMYVSSLVYGR